MSVLIAEQIEKSWGDRHVLRGCNIRISQRDRAALVGNNGSGKSTLLKILAGIHEPDTGEVKLRGTIAVLHQRPELSGETVADAAAASVAWHATLLHDYEAALVDGNNNLAADLQDQLDHRGWTVEHQVSSVLDKVGAPPMDAKLASLSGGELRRVALATVLLQQPDVLLLDEPTNHLDIESILWLEDFLKGTKAAVLMTCHDRDFMNRVVHRIIDVDDGQFISYGGDYDFMMREQEVRSAQKEAAYERQQAMIAKMTRFIDRFGAHVAKAAQAQSKQKKIDKIDQLEPPRKREVVSFQFRQPPRSGDDIVKLQGVDKAYGKKRIYAGLDFDVQRGERWCVMGQNGSGKTTLLKMIAGHLQPDGGNVKLGSVKMGYFAQQSLDLLDSSLTVYEQIDQKFNLESIGAKRTLLGAFGFSGDDHDKRVANLSGGEKSRLVLALMLFDPPNFLVLDEPTNHLDLDTKEMLVKTLRTFEGTMIFVSHDRTFLRGLANKVLDVSACMRGEPADRYPGSYVEWVEKTGLEAPGVHS